jgi:hypothetical protein
MSILNILVFGMFFVSFWGCKQARDSKPLVANGFAAPDSIFNNPVQMLRDAATGQGFCSLGFVNDTTAFTALHCVEQDGQLLAPSMLAVQNKQGRRFTALRVFANEEGLQYNKKYTELYAQVKNLYQEQFRSDPSCESLSSDLERRFADLGKQMSAHFDQLASYDMAILVFPVGTGASFVGADGLYFGLNKELVSEKKFSTKFIGYGNSQRTSNNRLANSCEKDTKFEGFGTRRQGFNPNAVLKNQGRTVESEGNLNSPKDAAVILSGDSGSVWIACQGAECNTMDAVAISSGVGLSEDGEGSNIGTNLYSDLSIALMKKAVECGGQNCAAKFRGYDEVVLGAATPRSEGPSDLKFAQDQDSKLYVSSPKGMLLTKLTSADKKSVVELKYLGDTSTQSIFQTQSSVNLIEVPLLKVLGKDDKDLYEVKFTKQ